MSTSSSYYIGLMSGTSVDSIDAALVDLSGSQIRITNTFSAKIDPAIKATVLSLALPGENEIALMRDVDQYFGEHFSQSVLELCKQASINPTSINAIGCHGQTIRHYPKDKTIGYSLQVGDPNIIAQRTGITTITDFRRRDIAADGHGAPLAPAFHQKAFSHQSNIRIVVNLGGIANISYIKANEPIVGFDSGPANILLDTWFMKCQAKPFDIDGLWAESGKVNKHLLTLLLSHPFFAKPFPKSTGREDFNLNWLESLLSSFHTIIPDQDIQATLLQLTIESVAIAIENVDSNQEANVYICGGGANNKVLMSRLATRIQPRTLATTSALGIEPDWVECAAFAWLAKQTIEHRSGNLPSVTGASKPVILGGIYWGD